MARELDIGMKCIKYMLFISNFMFVMVGFLLISIGSTISAVYNDFELFLESHHFKPAQLLIAVGIIIFFVALFGCIGAIKESTMLVNLYAFLLFILLILQISAAIAAYVMRSDIYVKIESNMNDALPDYSESLEARYSWDFMQERLYCCGVHSYEDWKHVNGSTAASIATNFNLANLTAANTIPESCYQDGEIYQDGCLDRLTYIISESALMLGVGATCASFVQLLGVIFAYMLAKTIRRVKTDAEIRQQENRQRIYEQLARGQEEKVVTPVLYTPTSTDA